MRFKLSVYLFFISSLLCAPFVHADVFSPYAKYNRLSYENMDTGTILIKGEFIFDYVFHKLGDNWTVSPDLSGMNKIFRYRPDLKPSNKWEDTYGQTLLLNLAIKPVNWFFAEFGFEMIGDYADRYWIPINHEHRMEYNDDRFPRIGWNNARIGIVQEWFNLTYFKNYGHNGWIHDGDMFEMFLKQDSPDNYLRYSGHYTPDYWQLKTRGAFGELDVIYGEEAVQAYKQGIYVKYKNIFNSNINFFYSDHIIPFGKDEDERMRNFQLNTDFNLFWGSNLQLGLLYRPFRLDWDYLYSEDIGYGNGIVGSKYAIKTGTTEQKDALGGAVKFKIPKKFALDNITLGYEYRGLVAGNRQRVDAELEKQLSKYSTASLKYYYQKPLYEALPLVFSAAGSGPAATSARGPESPFWVWWRNPVSGFDNRETSDFSFVYTYDPTPSTWFYQFEPNNPQEYNLNPEEDAPFSFAVKANIAQYFGGVDRQSYWEYDGRTVWEDTYIAGTAAPNRYIGSFYFLGQFIKDKLKILYDFEVGEDLATLSYPYEAREVFTTPMIGYFKTSLSIKREPYFFKGAYFKNYWGPEDWHKNFGATLDELYLAHISRDMGQTFNIGMEYVGSRKTDTKILDAIAGNPKSNNEMGFYDEIRVFVKVYFDALFNFGYKEKPLPFTVEYDMIPPQIALKVMPDTIYTDKNQKAKLEPWADDHSGIDTWEIAIRNDDGEIVKTYSGIKEPPEEIIWDGKNDDNRVLPDGLYKVTLEAYDNYGNTDITEPQSIRLMTTPVIKDTKIQETERGLVISFGAKVLFDTAKYSLKKGAVKTLKEVAELLKLYPDNDILIEGHTDSVGKVMYNQTLSENRANSVKAFLVKEGIAEERMKTKGYGKLKPIATNKTPAGREQNRRVELIILKEQPIVVTDPSEITTVLERTEQE